ncbi:MAG: type II/IV secretion system protein [Rhodanobacteraceae bacterium]|nr:type II/IV secretion system protein [Rhodanobacteraceae bacterium]
MAITGVAEYLAAAQAERANGGAEAIKGNGNDPRVVLLSSLDEVRRWLQVDHSTPLDRLVGFKVLRLDEVATLRHDDSELGVVAERAAHLGLPLYECDVLETDPAVRELLPAPVSRRLGVLPLATNDKLLAVLMSDAEACGAVEFMLPRRVIPILARPNLVRQGLSNQFDRTEDEAMIRRLGLDPRHGSAADMQDHDIERLSAEQPVVKVVAEFIDDAIRRRASDIHVRPGAETFELLYRIDGDLISIRRFLRPLLPAVVSRIKVLGAMNLAEHRVPQDGRASATSGAMEVDLRISVIPTIHGEAVVIRILNAAFGLRSVAEIGFGPRDEQLFRDVINRGQGMLLVTGPTGSGKSTTLYAAVLECRKQNVNIITVEDPVEAKIDDVLQVQINRAAGLTFGRTLRNILRHDPDVVMVGEIRDHETAEIAVESALTGHLVFSTLHTNNAATTITRLLDLGVLPFLLKSTLLAVLAQRLGRRNCKHCRVPEPVDPHVREVLGVSREEIFYVGQGCPKCDGRGVKGRIGIYELLEITPEMSKLIVPGADANAIHDLAEREGMISITKNAVALARTGTISLQEAFQVRVD